MPLSEVSIKYHAVSYQVILSFVITQTHLTIKCCSKYEMRHQSDGWTKVFLPLSHCGIGQFSEAGLYALCNLSHKKTCKVASAIHSCSSCSFTLSITVEAEPRTATAVQMPLLLCSRKLQGNGNAGWKKVSASFLS